MVLGFPGGSEGKKSACNVGDTRSIPGSGRSPREGNGYPLQYSLEKAMAPNSSTLAWKVPWMGEPGRLQSMGLWRVRNDWATSLSCVGEGNGNPLQCSCLEKPRDGGAWWAAVYGVAQSWTWLKRLSSSNSSRVRNAGLDEAQTGIKIAGRNINNLRYADDTTLVAESEKLKSLLM